MVSGGPGVICCASDVEHDEEHRMQERLEEPIREMAEGANPLTRCDASPGQHK